MLQILIGIVEPCKVDRLKSVCRPAMRPKALEEAMQKPTMLVISSLPHTSSRMMPPAPTPCHISQINLTEFGQ